MTTVDDLSGLEQCLFDEFGITHEEYMKEHISFVSFGFNFPKEIPFCVSVVSFCVILEKLSKLNILLTGQNSFRVNLLL